MREDACRPAQTSETPGRAPGSRSNNWYRRDCPIPWTLLLCEHKRKTSLTLHQNAFRINNIVHTQRKESIAFHCTICFNIKYLILLRRCKRFPKVNFITFKFSKVCCQLYVPYRLIKVSFSLKLRVTAAKNFLFSDIMFSDVLTYLFSLLWFN